MDAERLFPRLARHLAPGAPLCIVDGDGPREPPWQDAYVEFLQRWLPRVARPHDPQAYRAAMTRHEAWMDIDGRRSFAAPVLQPVEDFIELQHSRASFARHNLAEHEADYRRELAEILAPFADDAGVLSYEVSTDLTWGRPRSELAP